MIKITVVEETHEVILKVNGVDVPIDEIDYIPFGYCENPTEKSDETT